MPNIPPPTPSFDVPLWAHIADDVYEAGNSSRHLGLYYTRQLVDDDNFRARVYADVRQSIAVIAIRGSANWKDWVISDFGGIAFSFGPRALKLNTATRFTRMIKANYRHVMLTGHSLGGAYVQLLAALCGLPGVTFNAPGVLNILNEMSPNAATRAIGAMGGTVMNFLTHGAGDVLNRLVAGHSHAKGAHVINLRGNWDPVSKVGSHVGLKLQTLHCQNQHPHPHSMLPLIRALSGRNVRITH